jgi:hypothetical protein
MILDEIAHNQCARSSVKKEDFLNEKIPFKDELIKVAGPTRRRRVSKNAVL